MKYKEFIEYLERKNVNGIYNEYNVIFGKMDRPVGCDEDMYFKFKDNDTIIIGEYK